MDFVTTLYTRASCRTYTAQPISEDQLDQILAAASAAPVGMGAYGTVHLTVIRNQAFMQEINKVTAEFMKRDNDALYGAPVLILVSGKPGIPPVIECHNAGTIIENMTLSATDMGLGSVYIMGAVAALNTRPDLVAQLNLPEGFVPVAGMALGHPAQKPSLREATRKIGVSYMD